MAKIYLIKHAAPEKQQDVASDLWPLSSEGRDAAKDLAARLGDAEITRVISSVEPKAVQTAEILAERWGVPVEQFPGLHEHERRRVPVMRTGEYLSAMAQVFRRPSERVLGEESAAEALARFVRAYERVLAKYPDENLTIVTHGTVIALFVESIGEEDGYQVWRRMGLPSYVVIVGRTCLSGDGA